MSGNSLNHWFSKETMCEQVEEAARYHNRTVKEIGLPSYKNVLILLDVYCCNIGEYLLTWIKPHSTKIIIIFVPINMTELYHNLDLYLNALFKTIFNTLMYNFISEQSFLHYCIEDPLIV